jgi:hypothetical protein
MEQFLRTYPECFAARHRQLRPVVERVLRGFLKCGLIAWLRPPVVRECRRSFPPADRYREPEANARKDTGPRLGLARKKGRQTKSTRAALSCSGEAKRGFE